MTSWQITASSVLNTSRSSLPKFLQWAFQEFIQDLLLLLPSLGWVPDSSCEKHPICGTCACASLASLSATENAKTCEVEAPKRDPMIVNLRLAALAELQEVCNLSSGSRPNSPSITKPQGLAAGPLSLASVNTEGTMIALFSFLGAGGKAQQKTVQGDAHPLPQLNAAPHFPMQAVAVARLGPGLFWLRPALPRYIRQRLFIVSQIDTGVRRVSALLWSTAC